jgi:hypothetical protein
MVGEVVVEGGPIGEAIPHGDGRLLLLGLRPTDDLGAIGATIEDRPHVSESQPVDEVLGDVVFLEPSSDGVGDRHAGIRPSRRPDEDLIERSSTIDEI